MTLEDLKVACRLVLNLAFDPKVRLLSSPRPERSSCKRTRGRRIVGAIQCVHTSEPCLCSRDVVCLHHPYHPKKELQARRKSCFSDGPIARSHFPAKGIRLGVGGASLLGKRSERSNQHLEMGVRDSSSLKKTARMPTTIYTSPPAIGFVCNLFF